jgi:hypothetical protein
MENSGNKYMIFNFVDTFKLAATTIISTLPFDLCDEAAGTTSRDIAGEINTNAEKMKLIVGIIYTKAEEDETWYSTAVKPLDYLSLALSQPILDPEKTATTLVGALLMRRYMHSTAERCESRAVARICVLGWD